jgi:ketosteroid isomerase-like protein
VFVGISFDGGLGFSTGPWQWSESRENAQPAAQGYYATAWQKMDDGTWKMAADIGISFPDTTRDTSALRYASTDLYAYKNAGQPYATRRLPELDKKYMNRLNRTSGSFLANYFATNSLIERNGYFPYTPAQYGTIKEKNMSFRFEQTGAGLSQSETLGYTYGKVKISTTRNGKTTEEHKCFLRVWQKENRKDWKIVLDIIGGN